MPSQFPKPWRPIRGNYNRSYPSGRFEFNERDAGKVLATTLLFQPLVAATSGGLDEIAGVITPAAIGSPEELTSSVIWRWLWQTFAVAAMQAGACFLRNYGDSLIRDLGSWLWQNALQAAWLTFSELFLSWVPSTWQIWRRDDSPDWRDDEDDDAPPRRTSLWGRWKDRRRQRRERRRF